MIVIYRRIRASLFMSIRQDSRHTDKCRLCNQYTILLKSHVIPHFIIKRFKNTAHTGYMRRSDNINKRVQDGIKVHWLCEKCEALLSQFEKAFAENVFQPLNSVSKVSYGDWFLKFSASLSWRVLLYYRESNLLNHLTEIQFQSLDTVEKAWKDVLLGSQPNPGIYQQHLIYLGQSIELPGNILSKNVQSYISRSIDMDVVSSPHECFTYTKFEHFIILGFIQISPKQWNGSKIHVKHGVIGQTKYELSIKFWEYIQYKAQKAQEAKDNISDKQQEVIDQFFKDNSMRSS